MPSDLASFVTVRLAEACGVPVERLTPETSLLELDLDSLTLVSVLTQLEAAYGVELTREAIIAVLEAATAGELVTRLASGLPPCGPSQNQTQLKKET